MNEEFTDDGLQEVARSSRLELLSCKCNETVKGVAIDCV
jgi:hypothetical protein